jgi:putative hemolysin
MDSAFFWLLCNLISIIVLAFYSMMEMACVSYNQVRLHFYVSKKKKMALWLSYLLKNPSRLFGTTLIGVNVAMFAGSECARRFHESIGIDPNFAPISQVLAVVILAELAPMFAARHYPEHVAKMGVSLIYFSSKILSPIIEILSLISRLVNRVMGSKSTEQELFLSQEELQKILEEQDEEGMHEANSEMMGVITTNIFRLKNKLVKDVMIPLNEVPLLPSNATIAQVLNLMSKNPMEYLALYHLRRENIVGIAKPRDLVKAAESKRLRDYVESPWFITKTSHLGDILKQFKYNHENVAVVLNESGLGVGVITLDMVLGEIFGKTETQAKSSETTLLLLKDKTFPGHFTVGEFKKQFRVSLSENMEETLSNLIKENLPHPPEIGDSVSVSGMELTVKEASLLEIKSVSVSSKSR